MDGCSSRVRYNRCVWRFVACVVVAAALASCGSGDHAARHPSAAEEAAQMQQSVKRKALAVYGQCQDNLGEFVGRLRDLDGRVRAGMSFSDYASQLGDARAVYEHVPLRRIKDPRCLGGVGIPAEKAFNEHVKAANAWHRCLTDLKCKLDSIKPTLTRHWAKASRLARGAQANLDLLRRP
jgi:hypothetical protein